MKAARVVIGLSCAFVIFAAFHVSGLHDVQMIGAALTLVHFSHWARFCVKVVSKCI